MAIEVRLRSHGLWLLKLAGRLRSERFVEWAVNRVWFESKIGSGPWERIAALKWEPSLKVADE